MQVKINQVGMNTHTQFLVQQLKECLFSIQLTGSGMAIQMKAENTVTLHLIE